MTNPARARLVLRCVAGKRLPHHSVARKRDGLGVQTEALPSAWSFGLNRGQRIRKMAASDAANGKCRFIGYYPEIATTSLGRSPGMALPL